MKLIICFVLLRTAEAGRSSPPEVYVFARDTNVESVIRLTCLATGFYPQDIIMWIKKTGRILYREDGLESSGVRPNEDDTFQRRDSVEISWEDESKYTCEVIHEASRVNVTKEWENSGSGSGGSIGGAVVGFLVLVLVTVVLWCLYKKCIIGGEHNRFQGSHHIGSALSSSYEYDINFLADDNINGVPLTITGDDISYKANIGTICSPEVVLLPQNGNQHQ